MGTILTSLMLGGIIWVVMWIFIVPSTLLEESLSKALSLELPNILL